MTVEGVVENKNDQKSVLVGIKMNGSSQELLNWVIAKFSEPGDRIVAVHVCRASDPHENENSSAFISGYLTDYEGLYNAKKIKLEGQISWGNSIRKVLVREAKLCAAKALIVGMGKFNAFGGSLSLARYCAKKLPSTTSILAVHKGKLVFQKEATKQSSDLNRNRWPSIRSLLGLSIGDDTKVLNPSNKENSDVESLKVLKVGNLAPQTDSKDRGRDLKEIATEQGLLLSDKEDVTKSDGTETGSFSSSVVQSSIEIESVEEVEDERNHLAQEQTDEISCLISMRKHPEHTPGWPLLRRTVSPNSEVLSEARNMSVVQWVMSLPNRSLLLTPLSQIGSEPCRREVYHSRRGSTASSLSTWLELPKELETLIVSSSTSCRVFSREELESSITHFSPGDEMTTQLDVLQFPRSLQNSFRNKLLCSTTYSNAYENLIGKGGCSKVYKGCLPDGQQVAVKVAKSSKKAWEYFLLEVEILTSLQHKHITPLLGICVEDNDLISIFKFFPKGSLEEHLCGKGDKSVLPWEVRFKVAVGVAEALAYLHGDCSRPIIHRDVKSSNILLSNEFEPQLSDFGLALRATTTSAFVTHSDVVGTFGYLAPEYFMYGKVSEKIDAYSYGVLLLELLSGRRPINAESPKGQESLVMWAIPKLENVDALDLLDPNLSKEVDEKQMQSLVLAAILCITRPAQHRPHMGQILKLLQGDEDVMEWAQSEVSVLKESDNEDEEAYTVPSVHPHQIDLALFEADDDKTSLSSIEQNNQHSMEDYLRGRWSRSSSLD